MPVSPARSAAFDILLRVERESSYAPELLHSPAHERLSRADHALATEIVMGVLRWRSRLDHEIAGASTQPLAKLDLEILVALRLALYQLTWLNRIPARAAIHESVELVKRSRKRSAAAFVNAVLRKLAKTASQKPPLAAHEITLPESDTIAETFSHPGWLVERWVRHYGLTATQSICQHNQTIPVTAIRLRHAGAETQLRNDGIDLSPGILLASARRVRTGDVTKTQAIRTGQVVIQDEASQLVAALVGRGLRILDCCAAPGSKTLAIADRNPDAAVAAVELHPHRARLLHQLLSRRASADPAVSNQIHVLAADALRLPTMHKFDRVLADVPCSGTGTLARNPEIKWRLQPRDVAELQARQCAILRSALAQVAQGGRLIYSTCSLEKEENEDVIEHVLSQEGSVRVLNCRAELDRLKEAGELTWPDPTQLTRGPYLSTLPGVQPCDGFFAAILEKS